MDKKATAVTTKHDNFFSFVILIYCMAVTCVSAIIGLVYALDDSNVFLYVLMIYTLIGIVFSFLRTKRNTKHAKYFFALLSIQLIIEIAAAITLNIALYITIGVLGIIIGLFGSILCFVSLFKDAKKDKKKPKGVGWQIVILFFIVFFAMVSMTSNTLIYRGGYFEPFTKNDGTVIRNISYGPKGARNKMDIFLPKDLSTTDENEAILIIHGGSWVRGSKEQISNEGKRVAKHGYIGVTMNYSFINLDTPVVMDDILDEIDMALKQLKIESEKRGLNIKRVGFSGYSAGGHLALLYSYKKGATSPYKLCFTIAKNAPAVFTADNWKLKVLKEIAQGGLGFTKYNEIENIDSIDKQKEWVENSLKEISPHIYISASAPPTLFSYSENDTTVSPTQAKTLLKLFNENGVEHQFYLYKDSTHVAFERRDQHDGFYEAYFNWARKYFDEAKGN